jgi:hypothetical protein
MIVEYNEWDAIYGDEAPEILAFISLPPHEQAAAVRKVQGYED